ncbi:succinylglutamate desuccinylase/aspartoacylase family protein [Haliangium sp.]|uniref:succinylglutamate desuccinylase/aspartoacylase family protein n=1 Tax=Haliangium sp. TaxID=2663208 RepID=UPI003D0C5499
MSGWFSDPDCRTVDALDLDLAPVGAISRYAVALVDDALGRPVCLPVMIARGPTPGPVLGVTAAIHGNEVNGIRVVHKLFRAIEPESLQGTLIGVPIVSVPAYLEHTRTFREGFDLNRLMPGKPEGNVGQVYAHRLRARVITRFTHLVDLHTASHGRSNALYVRADLDHQETATLAGLISPEIIVHNEAGDGTLRGMAMEQGIAAITVEVGNPLRFQRRLITGSFDGVLRVMAHLGMIDEAPPMPGEAPVVCARSRWTYAQHGGLLEVFVSPADEVEAGQALARVTSVFGDEIAVYRAAERAVVVGISTNPICETGARVVHLGIPA